jgi:hypothetical protein
VTAQPGHTCPVQCGDCTASVNEHSEIFLWNVCIDGPAGSRDCAQTWPVSDSQAALLAGCARHTSAQTSLRLQRATVTAAIFRELKNNNYRCSVGKRSQRSNFGSKPAVEHQIPTSDCVVVVKRARHMSVRGCLIHQRWHQARFRPLTEVLFGVGQVLAYTLSI